MKRLFILLLTNVIFFAMSFAATLPIGNPSDGNAVVSTSQKKLNMRSGPGTDYGIVAQLAPGETAWVTDAGAAASGWVKIHNGTSQGYVSTEFIRSANGNDYIEWVCNYSGNKATREKASGKFMERISGFLGVFTDSFMALLTVPLWILLICAAGAIILEISIILLLKKIYRDYKSSALLYWVISISFLLNLCVLAMFPASEVMGRIPGIIWLLLAVSVFPLLVHSCWRLEQNGKVNNKYYRSNTKCGYVGKYLGIIAWVVMGSSIVSAIGTVVDNAMYNLLPIPDRFWPLVGTLVGVCALGIGIAYFWIFILKHLFQITSNIIAYLLSFCFIFVFVSMEIEVLNVFNGFYFVLAFCTAILVGIGSGYLCYKIIRQDRCANCHRFAGVVGSVSDNGYSVSQSDRWENISSSKISSYKQVQNARELRRTYTTTHHTTDHMCCEYCGHRWDVDNDNVVATRTEALERRWEERG